MSESINRLIGNVIINVAIFTSLNSDRNNLIDILMLTKTQKSEEKKRSDSHTRACSMRHCINDKYPASSCKLHCGSVRRTFLIVVSISSMPLQPRLLLLLLMRLNATDLKSFRVSCVQHVCVVSILHSLIFRRKEARKGEKKATRTKIA